MFGRMNQSRKRVKHEGEKPFWISYADLMTAMMVLFLTAMAVTIAAVTKVVEGPAEQRAKEVSQVCEGLKADLAKSKNINVDCANQRISFKDVGRFATNSYRLPDDGNRALAELVPAVIAAADGELGRKWMKQVVVEGYTDTVGGYLYNLHLSLQRSEWVMCMLMDPAKNADLQLSPEQLDRVRELFLAGGVSFNNQQATADESRRVEMRIQFYGLDDDPAKRVAVSSTNSSEVCQL